MHIVRGVLVYVFSKVGDGLDVRHHFLSVASHDHSKTTRILRDEVGEKSLRES